MTTLPQTTPLRLPRPAGAGQIAIPNVSSSGPSGQAVAGAGMTGAEIWRVFRSNWWLIALFVAVAAVAGFFINDYLAKHYPRYTASALVKVEVANERFNRQNDDSAASPQNLEIEQKTEARGLMTPGLMLSVITESDAVRNTEWFKQFNNNAGNAKEDLVKNFTVQPVPLTRLIQVEMTYRVPKDARIIVEEVVNRYITDRRGDKEVAWQAQAGQLRQRIEDMDRDIKKVSDQLTNNSDRGKESFELFGLVEVRRNEISRLTETLAKADQEVLEATNEKETVERMIAEGGSPPDVDAEILKYTIDSRRSLDAIDAQIAANGGSKTPTADGLMRRRQDLERRMEDEKETLKNTQIVYKKYEIDQKLRAAESARKAANDRLAVANSDFVKMRAEAYRYKDIEEQQRDLRVKRDALQEQYDNVANLKLTSKWAPVSMAQLPPTPEIPTFPKLPMTMAFAIMTGLALSIGIAFLREITDTSVRSPRDIARVGNLNLLGMIPHESDDPQSAGARLPLVIFDSPNSMAAEEFRKLRTRLQHTASLDSTRSILVSSANPGDGKTTVATNLAAGLALNGRRILLVDANFRRPEIHNLFEVANDRGFSDALNDLATFDTLVRDTPVQNLYVLPTGPRPVNATELLESQLLIDFIERALEDYDHVIFDSGPLLIVSETMALAPRVDGVITVVRARANSRGVLQRMRDVLRQVKAEQLGVVLNAVRSQGGGYYGRNIKNYYAYQNS